MLSKSIIVLSSIILVATTTLAQSEKPGLPKILPRDLEIDLALSSAPEHLRADASIYLLGEQGYELTKKGTNGFTCLVIRGPEFTPPGWENHISGWCFDEESMRTVGKVMLERAKLYRQGLSYEEVRNKINAGFASGEYVAPSKIGIIYMLSPVNKVPDHRTGKIFDYVPHVMYCSPNIINDDIGVPEEVHTGDQNYVWSGLPFLPTTGPHGFIVQPLGEKECAKIVAEYWKMIVKVREYVDLEIKFE